MGFLSHNCVRASAKYGKWYRVEGGSYALMSGVRLPVTNLQITTFGLLKHVDSMLQT